MNTFPRRPAAPFPFLALLCAACAQVAEQPLPDGGLPQPPHVAEVQPAPGAIAASARFHVAFSAPMDESLLLVDADHSETVVLVRAGDAEIVAAALAHGKLTARLRALLLAAHAAVGASAESIDLAPDQPLPAGEIFLLVASRLKDAAGRKLAGNGARFGFTVGQGAPLPALVAPRRGSLAPLNLARVRVAVPPGAQGKALALAGPAGPLWTGTTPAAPGTLALALCPQGRGCAKLSAGASYSLRFEGEAVPGADFGAASCRKDSPPHTLTASLAARDDRIAADAVFDWPVLARLELAKAPPGHAPGADDVALTRLCAQGACQVAEASAACEREGCAPDGPAGSPGAEPCAVHLEVRGLQPETTYLWRVSASDDEGNASEGSAARAATSAALPRVLVSEVMSWPPPPAPRHRGQYVELLNAGGAAIDLSVLALQGPDGKARPLVASAAGPVVLGPGKRALAVGSAFDAARYPRLPSAVPVLRAATHFLFGRGLRQASPDPFSLVLLREREGPLVLDTFPGGNACAAGESLERTPQDAVEHASFACGASGGSPGSPP
jgi:hypothetical protein